MAKECEGCEKRSMVFRVTVDTPLVDPDTNIPFIPVNASSLKVIVSGEPDHIFSLDLENTSECSILDSPLVDVKIPETGIYTFTQKFPAYTSSNNTYTFKTNGVIVGPIIDQYPNPVITLKKISNSTGTSNPQTLTLVGNDITETGEIFGRSSSFTGTTRTWDNIAKLWRERKTNSLGKREISWTAAKAEDYVGNLYISRQPKLSDISTSTSYTRTVDKKVIDKHEITLSTGTTNLAVGMSGEITSTFTKKVVKSIGTNSCYEVATEFKMTNTTKLLPGMLITHKGMQPVSVASVNATDSIITISSPRKIKSNTELTFSYPDNFVFIETIKDHHSILLDRPVHLHKNTTIVFDDNKSQTTIELTASGSGSSTITTSGNFHVNNFGTQDVVYSLNLDNFITNTPNAYNQDIFIKKNTATVINMINLDDDANASDKVGVVISGPNHGSVSSFDSDISTITYTPHTGYVGEDKFTFTMSDDTKTSAEKTIYITVI